MPELEETYVSHVGWLLHEAGDDVGRYLRQGWFEFAEQALWWLYLRPGDVVIDCGAHVGLFTLLASQAVGEYGKVIALEPNPETAAILRKNVEALGARNVEVIQAAAAKQRGVLTLHAGSGNTSAYSSTVAGAASTTNVAVEAVVIDDLIRERRFDSVALLKIDVEGAELDVWKGCDASARDRRIALAMVEFTEANQRSAGLTSMQLISAWNETGYGFHRFHVDEFTLRAAEVQGPIEYENLLATPNVADIQQRLRESSPQRQRLARDVISRGRAAHELLTRACEGDHFRGLVDDLKAQLVELHAEIANLHERLHTAQVDRGRFEQQLTEARHRAHTYAAYIDRVLNSKPGRFARTLRLANTPDWIEMMKQDLEQP